MENYISSQQTVLIFVDVFPQCFEGAKLLLNKGISSHFQVSHSLALSSLSPGAYHFGATYVGDKQTGPHEVPVFFSFYHIAMSSIKRYHIRPHKINSLIHSHHCLMFLKYGVDIL